MNHRHLLPNEIDLLVDGETGFGIAPLRAHLGECGDCRERYEALRQVAEAIDELPHHSPRLDFADRVMAKVQVVEPWHVGLVEGARRTLPTNPAMRALLAVGAGTAAVAVSGSSLYLAFRGDLLTWAVSVVGERGRATLATGAAEVAASALGPQASAALTTGGLSTLVLTAGLLALSALGAVLGFRRLAATARATRS